MRREDSLHSRGSQLGDESANSVCHRHLAHRRHVFCKLKLLANAIKTDWKDENELTQIAPEGDSNYLGFSRST